MINSILYFAFMFSLSSAQIPLGKKPESPKTGVPQGASNSAFQKETRVKSTSEHPKNVTHNSSVNQPQSPVKIAAPPVASQSNMQSIGDIDAVLAAYFKNPAQFKLAEVVVAVEKRGKLCSEEIQACLNISAWSQAACLPQMDTVTMQKLWNPVFLNVSTTEQAFSIIESIKACGSEPSANQFNLTLEYMAIMKKKGLSSFSIKALDWLKTKYVAPPSELDKALAGFNAKVGSFLEAPPLNYDWVKTLSILTMGWVAPTTIETMLSTDIKEWINQLFSTAFNVGEMEALANLVLPYSLNVKPSVDVTFSADVVRILCTYWHMNNGGAKCAAEIAKVAQAASVQANQLAHSKLSSQWAYNLYETGKAPQTVEIYRKILSGETTPEGRVWVLLNLGQSELMSGDAALAKQHLEEHLQIAKKLNFVVTEMGYGRNMLAGALIAQKKYLEAKREVDSLRTDLEKSISGFTDLRLWNAWMRGLLAVATKNADEVNAAAAELRVGAAKMKMLGFFNDIATALINAQAGKYKTSDLDMVRKTIGAKHPIVTFTEKIIASTAN